MNWSPPMPYSCTESGRDPASYYVAKHGRRYAVRIPRAPIAYRLNAYLSAIFAKGMRTYTVNFDRLARSFSCTRRTVENAVASLRKKGSFKFETVRVGRSYAVVVSDRNPYIKKFGILSNPKKKIQINTGLRPAFSKNYSRWASKPPPRKIRALAGYVARNVLAREHRAQSRTMFRFEHAYSFAVDTLHAGFGRNEIAAAYRYALRSIDDDLAHLPREIRWEPSSLVKLARFRLRDGQSAAARVRNRAAALRKPQFSVVRAVPAVTGAQITAQKLAEGKNRLAALMALYGNVNTKGIPA